MCTKNMQGMEGDSHALFPLRPWRFFHWAVVNKYRHTERVNIEVMIIATWDGQVPHPPVVVLWHVSADRCSACNIRGSEVVTMLKSGGPGPSLCCLIEEQMVAGGVNYRGLVADLDGEVIQVGVVVDHDCGDGFGLGFSGLGVGGQDLVARRQAGDGDGGAGGEQDLGTGGKALPAVSEGLGSAAVIVRGLGQRADVDCVQAVGDRVCAELGSAGYGQADSAGGQTRYLEPAGDAAAFGRDGRTAARIQGKAVVSSGAGGGGFGGLSLVAGGGLADDLFFLGGVRFWTGVRRGGSGGL